MFKMQGLDHTDDPPMDQRDYLKPSEFIKTREFYILFISLLIVTQVLFIIAGTYKVLIWTILHIRPH